MVFSPKFASDLGCDDCTSANYPKQMLVPQSVALMLSVIQLSKLLQDILKDLMSQQNFQTDIGITNNTDRRVLQRTVDETFKGFQEINPEIQLSRSKFAQIRPKSILTQSNSKWIQCL